MDLVYLSGSPRKSGNSHALARYFLDRCREHGANVTSYYLNDLNYSGCQACDNCKTVTDKCTLDDDLSTVLDHVFVADLVVLASPVYYGDVSAQLKGFIDRTYSYLKPRYIAEKFPNRLARPKTLVFILAQGHRDPQEFADILPRYSSIFKWIGFAETYPLRVVDVHHRGDIAGQKEIQDQAIKLADKLMVEYDAPC